MSSLPASDSSHASSIKNYKLILNRSAVGNVVDHGNLFYCGTLRETDQETDEREKEEE